ncbi:hypothetical protein [Catellatospora coxensis]|uniref:Uncharacterized protein n=1 Tax=Catellatospora coxensis TaxID=310354 RepID=A0A8J3KVM5_9ACTN|nr:hypothetical protein [Catellatospora coxensis]GIG09443.1 hypothetical protein Cco03nite_61430 [Catellatospora coxensis]
MRRAWRRWLARLCDREAMRAGVEVSALRSALVAEAVLARRAEELARRACRERDRYRGEAVALHAELAAVRDLIGGDEPWWPTWSAGPRGLAGGEQPGTREHAGV